MQFPQRKKNQEFLNAGTMVLAWGLQGFYVDGEISMSVSELLFTNDFLASDVAKIKNISNTCLFFLIFLNFNLNIWEPREEKIS